jgi:hypothetical protein
MKISTEQGMKPEEAFYKVKELEGHTNPWGLIASLRN